MFFSLVAALGPTAVAFKFCLLAALLIGMLFSDLEERILPDEFTIGGIVAGLALSWFLPVRDGTAQMLSWFIGLRDWAKSRACIPIDEREEER